MAFSFFGRKNPQPDEAPPALEEQKAEEVAAAPPAPSPSQSPNPPPDEPRRGFFDRMRQAVTRTRESFSESIRGIIALTREVDESTLQ